MIIMDELRAKKWEKTRRWGLGIFCIPRITGVFLVICAIDFFLVGRDWKSLAFELRENFLVAAVAGIVFSLIDWHRNEKMYREYERTHPARSER